MKKHLRTATVAFAATAVLLTGCDDSGTTDEPAVDGEAETDAGLGETDAGLGETTE